VGTTVIPKESIKTGSVEKAGKASPGSVGAMFEAALDVCKT
jgi:hypothetical protein